jgi:sugar phosphate isomerase/epimerase
MRLGADAHLTYCTNIHAGETWTEVRKNVETHVRKVKEQISPAAPFGVGLRLSALAAEGLSAPAELEAFRSFLHEHGLYVFTINGFPYGAFHGARVKERVYLPDWLEEPRLAYSDRLATLLAALLPPGSDLEGTVSTSPGAFKPRVRGPDDVRAMAERMIRHAVTLHRLREETGKTISLAIEPEPACHLETIDETVAFFEEQLFSPAGVADCMRHSGVSRPDAEALLRRHLGVCFDACHMAVEFEEPRDALARLAGAGIRVGKVQISAGLEARLERGAEVVDALRAFDDGVYLHQAVERREGRLIRYLDLPELFARDAIGGDAGGLARVHCHVPIFREKLGPFDSTQRYLAEVLALLKAKPASAHFEVETYTWDVLPAEYKTESIALAVARELRWVVGEMTRS